MLSVVYAVMLSVTYKPLMLSVIMLNVVMLSVAAPLILLVQPLEWIIFQGLHFNGM